MTNDSKKAKGSKSQHKSTNALTKPKIQQSPDPRKLEKLKKCENIIKEGILKYYEMGAALSTIREEELYKEKGHRSFSEYCKTIFNFGRAYGYRLSLYLLHDEEDIKKCWAEARKEAGNEMPAYKAVDKLVREQKRLKCEEKKKFIQAKQPDQIFLTSLNNPTARIDPANDLIQNSGDSFHKLYNAIKESNKRGIVFSKKGQELLKNELLKRQEKVFYDLFTDEE